MPCRNATLSPVSVLIRMLKVVVFLTASTSWFYFARPETRAFVRTSVTLVFVCDVDLEGV